MTSLSTRLAVVGAVVFAANAGLLVLQLVAGPLLSPFIGSSLETWTSIIAAFLSGIALGNFWGGRLADRSPTLGRLVLYLALGAAAAGWMLLLPMLIRDGVYRHVPLGVRIPLLAFAHCLPVATVLSLLTPLAIRIGVPDVAHTGRVAGTIFALSTFGCLVGNYVTGFALIPNLPIDTIILGVAGLLAILAAAVLLARPALKDEGVIAANSADTGSEIPWMSLRLGFAIVFGCSFAGMTLELAAMRLVAVHLGNSIYTWTGVIGAMLLGTTLGNAFGGWLADRAARGSWAERRELPLAWTLLAPGLACIVSLVIIVIVSNQRAEDRPFVALPLMAQIVLDALALFFPPMFALGMVSPQVIRLCTAGVGGTGRTAGRIYGVSTLGAIVGTFVTGYAAISVFGVNITIVLAGVLPALAVLALSRIVDGRRKFLVAEQGAMLYVVSAVLGSGLGGVILGLSLNKGDRLTQVAHVETNYYTIRVETDPIEHNPPSDALSALVGNAAFDIRMQRLGPRQPSHRILRLDHLTHSRVDLDDPTFFFYRHELIQAEMLRLRAAERPDEQSVLVIGGGGYTFPRYVRTCIPTAAVDVVEIDPGVTRVACEVLGLKPEWGVRTFNMDGRQYVAEKSPKGHYDLVTLDAVNDLSVPSHLLTKECNDAVKATMRPEGIYLVTVIDLAGQGQLWKAAFRTLKESFAHVELMFPRGDLEELRKEFPDHSLDEIFGKLHRSVIVIYASDRPIDQAALQKAVHRQTGKFSNTYTVPPAAVEEMLAKVKPLILTDRYAPTDELMRKVFDGR